MIPYIFELSIYVIYFCDCISFYNGDIVILLLDCELNTFLLIDLIRSKYWRESDNL
jgi:hypothetical protein